MVSSRRLHSVSLLSAMALLLVAQMGCEGKKPVTLEVQVPMVLKKKGSSQELTVTAKDAKGRPFIGKKPNLSAESSDASVVDVTTDETTMKVKATARNGGKATITIHAFDLETTTEIVALIPDKIKISGQKKSKLKIGQTPHTLSVEVFDAKGQPLEGVPVLFSVSDYCVTVDSNGLVEPVAAGECSVIATAGDATDTVNYIVK